MDEIIVTPEQRNATMRRAHEFVYHDSTKPLDDVEQLQVCCMLASVDAELTVSTVEVARLTKRVAELHQAMVRIANETPFPDEVAGWAEQRAKMIAELGTARAETAEVTRVFEKLKKATLAIVVDRDEAKTRVLELELEVEDVKGKALAALAALEADNARLVAEKYTLEAAARDFSSAVANHEEVIDVLEGELDGVLA